MLGTGLCFRDRRITGRNGGILKHPGEALQYAAKPTSRLARCEGREKPAKGRARASLEAIGAEGGNSTLLSNELSEKNSQDCPDRE